MAASFTVRGRPAFVVNVEVFLHRGERWLLIKRGAGEAHAPGSLAGVGGKVDADAIGPAVLEETARREVVEEIGVDLAGVELRYVSSVSFTTDDGDPIINVVFSAPLPVDAQPTAAAPDEVADIVWRTEAEAAADPCCPPWTLRALRQVAVLAGPADAE